MISDTHSHREPQIINNDPSLAASPQQGMLLGASPLSLNNWMGQLFVPLYQERILNAFSDGLRAYLADVKCNTCPGMTLWEALCEVERDAVIVGKRKESKHTLSDITYKHPSSSLSSPSPSLSPPSPSPSPSSPVAKFPVLDPSGSKVEVLRRAYTISKLSHKLLVPP